MLFHLTFPRIYSLFAILTYSRPSESSTLSSLTKTQKCSSQEVYTPSDNDYIFSLINLNPLNLWDGPTSLSAAPTTLSTTTFTVEELKYYNWFTAAMYCPYSLPNLSCCHCGHFNASVTYHSIFANQVYGTKGMVTLHPGKREIVVSLRGSVTMLNWVMDFYQLPTTLNTTFDSDGVKIHRGFHLSTMSIYNEIVLEIGRLLEANPEFRVVFTGHSLGGSMASLFVYFLTSLNQFPGTNYALATYGMMRAGNKAFVNYMNSLNIPMARVVARADIIPHIISVSASGALPLLLGVYYLHHGPEIWINGESTIFCSRTQYEDPTCSNRMGPKYTLLDHVQYFEADYTTCYLTEGWLDVDLLSLPIGWTTPTIYLPSMPVFLEGVVGKVVQGGYQGLLPPL